MGFSSSQSPRLPGFVWLPLVFMVAALVLRVLTQQGMMPASLANFSPMMALAFVGALVFPKPLPWWSWLVILLGVDWMIAGSQWWVESNGRPEVLLVYGCYALAAWTGGWLRGRAGVVDTLLGTLGFSVLFYLATNTLSWWIQPYYAKDLGGWVQALTVGVPGPWPSTLAFFRNSLVADFLGASVLLAAYNLEALVRGLRRLPWSGTARLA